MVDLRSGVDALFEMPSGLPPASCASLGASLDGLSPFLAGYEGGWQELFPSAKNACVHDGKHVPFHGEVALREWRYRTDNSRIHPAIVLEVECDTVPLLLRRTMYLAPNDAVLILDETVENVSDHPTFFVWGHHFVVGAPLLAEGTRIEAAAGLIVTDRDADTATARLSLDSEVDWPFVPITDGSQLDIRTISGPISGTHDHYFLTKFSVGRIFCYQRRYRPFGATIVGFGNVSVDKSVGSVWRASRSTACPGPARSHSATVGAQRSR